MQAKVNKFVTAKRDILFRTSENSLNIFQAKLTLTKWEKGTVASYY